MHDRPIKIMRIIARLNIGGPALHVILLTSHLSPPKFDSTLICGQIDATEGDMIYLAEEYEVKPLVIPELGRNISILRDIRITWKLFCLMRQYKPDIVHTHTAKAGFVGRLAAWLARVPVRIHTFHGHVFHGYFGKRKTQLFLGLERLCSRISTRIITISPKLRDELVQEYRIASADKFVVIPLGFDLTRLLNPASRNFRVERDLPQEAKLVGIVGRLVPIKNHALFLQAIQYIQGDDIHFVVIGDGETRAEMEELADELDIADRVTFVGWVKDLGSALYELSAVVLTSINEGTPVSLIEAMAAGVPVISTAVGGVPDVLDNGRFGTLVPPSDPEALAKAIVDVLDGKHPDLATAQQSAFDRYDVSRLTQNLGSLYIGTLNRVSRQRLSQ